MRSDRGSAAQPHPILPYLHPAAALKRRNWVIDRMVVEHMISPKLAEESKAKPMVVKTPTHDDTEIAPHFVEWVRESLAARYSTDEIWRKGLQVYTTLNIPMQRAARTALQEGLRNYDKRRGWRGPIGNVLKTPSTSIANYFHPNWRRNIHPGDIAVGLVEDVGSAEATVRIGAYHGMLNNKEIAWTNSKSVGQVLKPGDLAYFKILSLDEARKTVSISLEQRPSG